MQRLWIMLAVAAAVSPVAAGAQLYPGRIQQEPTAWVGLGVGAFTAGDVADGRTGSSWDFGNRTSAQYRASLERPLRGGTSIGLSGTFVRAPIHYRASGPPPHSCVACAADVDVFSLYGAFRAGGGPAFHQVIEAGLGVTSYQNFRREDTQERLEPLDARRNLGFYVGYGFGYTLSPRSAVNLVQEYGMNFHSARDTPPGSSNALRFYTTRLGFRMGMGGASPGPRRR